MVQQFPHALRAKIEEAALEKSGVSSVVQSAGRVSERYRRLTEGEGNRYFQLRNEEEALAYLVARLPATFTANISVFGQIKTLMPCFFPATVLDVGAGPGTASYAASQIWDFSAATLLEPNSHLRSVGTEFIVPEMDADISWIESGVEKKFERKNYDLVLASYVLNELESHQWADVLRSLWDLCSGVLVIVETGTPFGFSVIERVRKLASGFSDCYLVGPCPQMQDCPLSKIDGRWCHFSVRVERSKLHKMMKSGAILGYEDEKFSWIAFSRNEVKRCDFRLLGRSSGSKVRQLQVCDKNGEARTLEVAKSSDLFKVTKKLDWGDGFEGS
ncbi:MAG: methyltransferase domain-containing protein [Alphaproteobacteria bacterium]|nr:methyltransferase domain-containing protein [Alphaproteobacteria bacterium]MCB1551586.1 methyltransferase domain-containing protein [Alphaproteobacteria bacterium]MCB9984934.1 methyltransferase domain-containing protein [Micavibrio sp.]HPQ50118.1 small ribosomal subunit Rsm22 family protein [Alphaproteobacteria bacterium]HRK97326.1 small ribosomal subunit Rsm22 family protein [Alphaproteobacteria bacterium]